MIAHRIGAELKDQAEKKVDQAKDKANELANDAKKKGEGKTREHRPIDRTKKLSSSRSQARRASSQCWQRSSRLRYARFSWTDKDNDNEGRSQNHEYWQASTRLDSSA